MSDWITVKGAAEALGLSESTVYEMAEKAKIAHYRVGLGRGQIRFKASDLDAYLESRRVGPRPKPPVDLRPRVPIPRPTKDYFKR